MGINQSALKRERQNIVRRERNRVIKSKVHTARRRLIESIEANNREEVETRMRTFMSVVDKAVKRKLFHRNKGARLKSRITKLIKKTFNENKEAS